MLFQDMSNNVLTFLMFSIIAIVIYYVIPRRGRCLYLITANILFYMLCDLKMFLILGATIIWTWLCAQRLEVRRCRGWLAAGVCSLVGLLSLFKYNQYLMKAVNAVLGAVGMGSISGIWNLLMPLGISYYIFKSISYLVDVYRGKYQAEKSLIKYALYVSFFPEILCGPISRYDEFKASLENGMTYSDENMQRGFYLMLKGVFMKVVIANRLAGYVGAVFAEPSAYNGIALWMAAFFYAIWLYCDFAGYSFIAIGITQLFGLHYKENFNRPYFASNIREFWDRWHISLSDWLRDYVYFPLGGSRCTRLRSKCNVMVVFLVSGLWHGSGIHFLVWGAYHGLLNVFTPQKRNRIQSPEHINHVGKKKKVRSALAVLWNFSLVTLGWIFFGVDSLNTAVTYLKGMFTNLKISVSEVSLLISVFLISDSP